MKKKILSMVMAAALVMSVSSVSQAADATLTQDADGKYAADAIVATGAYEAPTITVSIDTTAKDVIVNPYGLTTSNSAFTSLDADSRKEQLISKVDSIENKSAVALAVNATLSASVEGSTKIATAPVVPATEKANSVFAYLNVTKGASAETKMLLTDNAYDAKNENQAVFTAKATTKKALVTLDPSTGTNKTASYKILGTVAANPTIPWKAADKIKFTIVFDFEPKLVTSGS